MRAIIVFGLVFLSLFASIEAHALSLKSGLSVQNPRVSPHQTQENHLMFEGWGGFSYHPKLDFNLELAPRAGVLSSSGGASRRLDFFMGTEVLFWSMNAIGVGASIDLLWPGFHFGERLSARVRFGPLLSLRVKRVREAGALSVRLGAVYDNFYRLAGWFGIALRFEGVE